MRIAILFVLIGAQLFGQTLEEKVARLERRVEELEQLLRDSNRFREVKAEESVAKPREAAVVAADGNGSVIRSASSDFQLRIGGNMTVNGRSHLGADTGAVDTFLLRRVRPTLQGTVFQNVDFRLMPDFAGGQTVLQDAYVELRYLPRAAFRAGKYKPPVGLERLQQDTDIWFVERGLPTGLVPNRDVGYQVSGDLIPNKLNYAVGVFDGSPDGGLYDMDANNGKDVAVRVFGSPLPGLGIGISATTGNQEGSPLPSFRSFSQATFFTYASTVTATNGRTRYSPQGYYFRGPLGIMAEYVRSEQQVRSAGGAVTVVSNSAWNVAGAWLLTGENKSFRMVNPRKIFDPAKGAWGAWEVLLRAGELSIDPAVYAYGLADRERSARRAQEVATGLNWYANREVKLGVNFGYTRFTGGAAVGNRPAEKTFLSLFQIAF